MSFQPGEFINIVDLCKLKMQEKTSPRIVNDEPILIDSDSDDDVTIVETDPVVINSNLVKKDDSTVKNNAVVLNDSVEKSPNKVENNKINQIKKKRPSSPQKSTEKFAIINVVSLAKQTELNLLPNDTNTASNLSSVQSETLPLENKTVEPTVVCDEVIPREELNKFSNFKKLLPNSDSVKTWKDCLNECVIYIDKLNETVMKEEIQEEEEMQKNIKLRMMHEKLVSDLFSMCEKEPVTIANNEGKCENETDVKTVEEKETIKPETVQPRRVTKKIVPLKECQVKIEEIIENMEKLFDFNFEEGTDYDVENKVNSSVDADLLDSVTDIKDELKDIENDLFMEEEGKTNLLVTSVNTLSAYCVDESIFDEPSDIIYEFTNEIESIKENENVDNVLDFSRDKEIQMDLPIKCIFNRKVEDSLPSYDELVVLKKEKENEKKELKEEEIPVALDFRVRKTSLDCNENEPVKSEPKIESQVSCENEKSDKDTTVSSNDRKLTFIERDPRRRVRSISPRNNDNFDKKCEEDNLKGKRKSINDESYSYDKRRRDEYEYYRRNAFCRSSSHFSDSREIVNDRRFYEDYNRTGDRDYRIEWARPRYSNGRVNESISSRPRYPSQEKVIFNRFIANKRFLTYN